MQRFRELREIKGGTKRASQFFRENVGRIVHRSIVQTLLHDQLDFMKRMRNNGGARGKLAKEGIDLLSGTYHRKEAEQAGFKIEKDELVAIRAKSS